MENKITVGTRLKQIMNERNIKQVDILTLTLPYQIKYNVRIAKNDLSQYVNDKVEPNQERLYILAKALDVTEPWLMGYDVPMKPAVAKNIIKVKKTKNIPIIGRIACGEPILADENITDTFPISVDLIPNGDLFFLQASGDSMEPDIKNNSLVLLRQQDDVENGEIGAVLLNGGEEATLKKVRKLGDTIVLEALNNKYEPIIVNEDNPARIIGKAIHVINKL